MDTGLSLPDINVITKTYKNETGELLDLFDILPEGLALEELSDKVKKRIEGDLEQGILDAELVEENLAPAEFNFARFAVDSEYIVFFFPPQTLAPWRIGTVRVEVPLELL